MTETDIAEVGALWTEYWESLGLPLEFQDFGAQLKRLPGEFAAPFGLLLLASNGSAAAGTIALLPLSAEFCEIKRLYVPPQFRGAGLGKRLISTMIENARAMGYKVMFADTLLTMQTAAHLYETFGFQRVDAYSPHPTPEAIYFRLAL